MSADPNKRTVLIADDSIENINLLEKRLAEAGYDICVARDGYEALSKAQVLMPDLILLDVMIRGLHGMEVKNRLNKAETTVNIPVIFLTEKASTDEKVKGFNLKADDFITKPFDFPELLARIDSISSRRRQYEHIFMTDALTGLNNVHVFKKNFTVFFDIARRYKRMFSIAVIDVDEFKSINDTYGHAVGDVALRTVSQEMMKVFRAPDILIRYGGDEFVILLPETDQKQAFDAVARFRLKLEALEIPAGRDRTIHLKMSLGVVGYDDKFRKPIDLFNAADQEMYKDKRSRKVKKEPATEVPQVAPRKR